MTNRARKTAADVADILDQEGAEAVSVGTLCREAGRVNLIRSAQRARTANRRDNVRASAVLVTEKKPQSTREFLDLIADPRTDPLSHASLAQTVDVSLRTVETYRPKLWTLCGRHRAEQLRHMDEGEIAEHHATRQKVCDRLKVYRRRATVPPTKQPKSEEDYKAACAQLRRHIRRLERRLTKRDNRIDKLRKTGDAKTVQALLRVLVGALAPSAVDDFAFTGELELRAVAPHPGDWERVEPLVREKHRMIASHYRNEYKRNVCGVSPATKISEEEEDALTAWVAEQVEADPLWPDGLDRR